MHHAYERHEKVSCYVVVTWYQEYLFYIVYYVCHLTRGNYSNECAIVQLSKKYYIDCPVLHITTTGAVYIILLYP